MFQTEMAIESQMLQIVALGNSVSTPKYFIQVLRCIPLTSTKTEQLFGRFFGRGAGSGHSDHCYRCVR